MTTQNEESSMYEFQSFDPFPKAPMYPVGWDLSEMQPDTKDVEPETSSVDEEKAD